MKNTIIILSILLLISCKSKKPIVAVNRFKVVSKEAVDQEKQSRAYAIGKRLLSACNTSKFTPFSNTEATEKVIANATVEKISETCKKINFRNGKFNDLNLIEVLQDKETNDLIFRYDINFEKKLYKREIKITVNTENKVSEITTKEVPKVL
jgi:hypothetical protein